jgi:hypothetical protein
MTRSLLTLVLFLAIVAGAAWALALDNGTARAGPAFRIIDVRAEYGHLIVEVQHYAPDGSHWFYENYTWQGREQFNRPRVMDRLGVGDTERFFLKSDGRVAPARLNLERKQEHYLPEGEEWLRHNYPNLTDDKVTFIIQYWHNIRQGTEWTRGKQRLTTHPMDYTGEDAAGARRLKTRFSSLINAAYSSPEPGVALAWYGHLPPVDPYVSSAYGTVSTFVSGEPPVDGRAARDGVNEAWATIHSGAGNYANDTGTVASINVQSSSTTNKWCCIISAFNLFDTSSLPDGDLILSGTFGFAATVVVDTLSPAGSVSMVATDPASTSNIVSADWDLPKRGSVKQGTDLTLASLTADSSTLNLFTLNSTGLGNITQTGVTKFGIGLTSDVTDTEPTWSNTTGSDQSRVGVMTAESAAQPTLSVTHVAISAAVTGTIGDGATEQEVRDGSGTIIITLTDDTWVAAGATFDAQRQNIIDGLDSAQSEANGWNNEVRDKIGVTSVVRTSGTIVTVTLSASEVADYQIDSAETITVTVPGGAMVLGGGVTATPTIDITPGTESVAVGGTLGASGGTPSEIVAGDETITLTLSGAAWVAAGATFEAQRQNIIDGLTSNRNDANGWNNRRADFPVTDVVRTSAALVTITLSASSAYAIPSTETITMVVPASAMNYPAPLTGSPLFDIVASFVSSGTRVSEAINLSGITDVAYCAIGWQATIPTSTTVSVETSINGGAIYSTATNGSCPTGITPGATLADITDFRIRVNLDTTDSSVTPLVEGLGLLVQDTAGPALYYQLNTVPGVTITDRSANSNTGTMSFPTSQAGINSTTGVLESTRSSLSLEQLLSVGDIVSPVTGAAASGNIFNQTETGFGSLPFQDLMQTMATGGELPLKFVWVVAIGLFSIALGVVALHMTGSLMISGIGLGAGLSIGAAIGGGLIPGWTIFLFVILALALVVMRSRGSLPL